VRGGARLGYGRKLELVDFVGYAEHAASLVNAAVEDRDDLCTFLDDCDREWLVARVSERDLPALRRFQRDARLAFEAAARDDETDVVRQLNDLLNRHPITPQIAGHDAQSWHLHVSNSSSTVSELLIAEALLGLVILACDLSPLRLGVCQAAGCEQVFVDTSPNQSRRYCSDRCSSRANVAAYRARRKAAAAASTS
jgi:predicted RNA-binding Zn ribbon-like protein